LCISLFPAFGHVEVTFIKSDCGERTVNAGIGCHATVVVLNHPQEALAHGKSLFADIASELVPSRNLLLCVLWAKQKPSLDRTIVAVRCSNDLNDFILFEREV